IASFGSRRGAIVEERVDLRSVDVDLGNSGVELVDLDPQVLVRLRVEPQGVGADSQVRIHRDEDGRRSVRIPHVDGGLQNGLILRRMVERGGKLGPLGRNGYLQAAAGIERYSLRERSPTTQTIEQSGDRTGIATPLGAFPLELIDLLDDVD